MKMVFLEVEAGTAERMNETRHFVGVQLVDIPHLFL